MEKLTFTGEASTFEALREYLNMNASTVFAHVIESLDKALIKHRADVEFDHIGKYRMFGTVQFVHSFNGQ